MKFTLSINMDNAAFEDNPGAEISRILKQLVNRFEHKPFWSVYSGGLFDMNGNMVGTFEITEED